LLTCSSFPSKTGNEYIAQNCNAANRCPPAQGMLVAMGSALFVISRAASEMSMEGISWMVQGIAIGIAFIGAGAILKRRSEGEIEGLTTSAGIYMTAATGLAVGLG
jgi:putative Mg2+ transporter-C (MgtC) family protein